MRLASLPWYDLAELRVALDAFWSAIASRLEPLGLHGLSRLGAAAYRPIADLADAARAVGHGELDLEP